MIIVESVVSGLIIGIPLAIAGYRFGELLRQRYIT